MRRGIPCLSGKLCLSGILAVQIIGEIQCDYVYVDNVVLGHLLLEEKLRSSPQVRLPILRPMRRGHSVRHGDPVWHGIRSCMVSHPAA